MQQDLMLSGCAAGGLSGGAHLLMLVWHTFLLRILHAKMPHAPNKQRQGLTLTHPHNRCARCLLQEACLHKELDRPGRQAVRRRAMPAGRHVKL